MLPNDISLCHGRGNLGRTCAMRHSCARYVETKKMEQPGTRSQHDMLCRPTILLTGDGGAMKNAYHYYIAVKVKES